jgi:hypothetical protein
MNRSLLIAVTLALPGACLAEAKLEMLDKTGKVDATYQIKDGKVHVKSVEAPDVAMVYDAATHAMTVIDHGRKSYVRMDAETAAAAGAVMSDAMKEMEKRIATLPPEQQEAMRKLMPQAAGGGTAVPAVKAVATGKSDTVDGVGCDVVNVTLDGKPLGEACVTKAGLALDEADRATLNAMFDDMSKMASSVTGGTAEAGKKFAALDGIPLRWRDADTGRETLTRLDAKASVEAAAFEIPAGYSEQKLQIPNFR